MIKPNKVSINKFIDDLQSEGRYTFTRQEITKKLGKSEAALRLALNRLQKTGRIISPKRGFHVIVPLEYKFSGGPPPLWYLQDLSRYLGCSYYLGLLSAAEIYGAAHQSPQELQVVTDVPQRPIKLKRSRIRFFHKWNLEETPIIEHKVSTGIIRVSTSEATAIDLVRYWKDVGSLNNIATILLELAPSMHKSRLVATAKKHIELSVIQRLGYLLDLAGQNELSEGLLRIVKERTARLVRLRPDIDSKDAKINSRWSLYINEKVEPDL